MANITAAQVQATGGWTTTEAPDATLALAPYIPAGDGWLNEILSNKGTDLTTLTAADADKGALALAAECYYVAHLFASRPSKNDFRAGPVESKNKKAADIVGSAEWLLKKAKEMLAKAGIVYEKYGAVTHGGDDYHPDGDEKTQIDLGLAYQDSDEELNFLGVDDG